MRRPEVLLPPKGGPIRAMAGLAGICTAIAATVSCAQVDLPHWRDGLVADSPCYRVDLRDGLDEAMPSEVEDLFGCLDHWGHLESLRPTMAAAQGTSPGGGPATLEIARAVNAMPEAGADPVAVLGAGIDLLRDPANPLDGVLDIGLEWITGTPAPLVRAHAVSADAPDVLASGVLAPMGPVLPDTATALLDHADLLDDLGAALRGQEADRTVRWLDAVASSPHPDVRVAHRLIGDLGDMAGATRDPSNDRWTEATGDSLRDLVVVLVDGGDRVAGLDAIEAPVARILGDDALRARIETTLAVLAADGTLDGVPSDLGWMARVNVDGEPTQRGELSGLEALARLLHTANTPMVCALDVGPFDIEVDLGNLSIALLRALAEVDPSTIQTGAGVLGTVVGWDLSQSVLGWIAASETCTVLTPTLVEDLRAIDLLFEDDADDLVVAFMALLRDLDREDRVPELVGVASGLWRSRGIRAFAEVVRDTSDEPAWHTAIALVPVLLDPEAHGLPPDGVTFADLWGAAHAVFRPRTEGSTWSRIAPVGRVVVRHEGTWSAVHALSDLAADGSSRTSDALRLVPDLVAADPDGVLRDAAAALVTDDTVALPLLRLLATPGVAEALLADTTVNGQEQVPLAFGARLVTEGAVDDLLVVVEQVLESLSADVEP